MIPKQSFLIIKTRSRRDIVREKYMSLECLTLELKHRSCAPVYYTACTPKSRKAANYIYCQTETGESIRQSFTWLEDSIDYDKGIKMCRMMFLQPWTIAIGVARNTALASACTRLVARHPSNLGRVGQRSPKSPSGGTDRNEHCLCCDYRKLDWHIK